MMKIILASALLLVILCHVTAQGGVAVQDAMNNMMNNRKFSLLHILTSMEPFC